MTLCFTLAPTIPKRVEQGGFRDGHVVGKKERVCLG
jgi:hypothetical protein